MRNREFWNEDYEWDYLQFLYSDDEPELKPISRGFSEINLSTFCGTYWQQLSFKVWEKRIKARIEYERQNTK